jgi:hypothetical protein
MSSNCLAGESQLCFLTLVALIAMWRSVWELWRTAESGRPTNSISGFSKLPLQESAGLSECEGNTVDVMVRQGIRLR